MSNKPYVTKDIEGYNFDARFQERIHCTQVFRNRFMSNIIAEEVIQSKHSGRISDADLEVIQFLFDYTFATIDVIRDLFFPELSEKEAADRVEVLIRSRFLNKFCIVQNGYEDVVAGTIPEDAMTIYCLDYAGKILLMHYGSMDGEDVSKWNSSAVMMSAARISSKLTASRLYASLKSNCEGNLVYMKSGAPCGNRKRHITPSFEFAVNSANGRKYFIGLTAKELSLIPHFKDHVVKIDDFFSEVKDWTTVFGDGDGNPPVVIVIADNDQVAVQAAEMISRMTKLQAVRYTTDARIRRNLSEVGAFLKFVPEGASEEYPAAHLEEVKASVFVKP